MTKKNKAVRESNFFVDLKSSMTKIVDTKVKEILSSCFPDATTTQLLTNLNDLGVDYRVNGSGYSYNIDLKYRNRDNVNGDVAIEIWSNIQRKKPGWLEQDKLTDYILWVWKDNTHYLVDYKKLKKIFIINKGKWAAKYRTAEQKTLTGTGYHSLCCFVPVSEIEFHLAME